MVHIEKAEKKKILFEILNVGVICVKKKFDGKHPDLKKIDNLKVWMMTRSLESRGFLNVTFSWQHSYYTLTQEGIVYIKKELNIQDEAV